MCLLEERRTVTGDLLCTDSLSKRRLLTITTAFAALLRTPRRTVKAEILEIRVKCRREHFLLTAESEWFSREVLERRSASPASVSCKVYGKVYERRLGNFSGSFLDLNSGSSLLGFFLGFALCHRVSAYAAECMGECMACHGVQ